MEEHVKFLQRFGEGRRIQELRLCAVAAKDNENDASMHNTAATAAARAGCQPRQGGLLQSSDFHGANGPRFAHTAGET